jgi:uncharacterized protein RhaS with RHS repeats
VAELSGRLARYYDPATDQFLTVDPDVATTLSPYGYVSGNPLNATDPQGLVPCFTSGFGCGFLNAVRNIESGVGTVVGTLSSLGHALYQHVTVSVGLCDNLC